MIKFTENISITADDYQYIVGKPRQTTDKDGNVLIKMDNPCYFQTLSSALKCVLSKALRKKIASGEITKLDELVIEQKFLQEKFEKMLEPLQV